MIFLALVLVAAPLPHVHIDLTGTWRYEQDGFIFILTLKPDGTCTENFRTKNSTFVEWKGNWKRVDRRLLISLDSTSEHFFIHGMSTDARIIATMTLFDKKTLSKKIELTRIDR